MRAEEETDAATRRAEEAEAALSVARSGPDVAEDVRLELQAAMARIDTLSKAVGDQTGLAHQANERAFVLEEELRVGRERPGAPCGACCASGVAQTNVCPCVPVSLHP